jgi:hypothetical protein
MPLSTPCELKADFNQTRRLAREEEVAAEGMGLPQELEICPGDDVEAIADAVRKLHEDVDLNLRCRVARLRYVESELSVQKLDHAMGVAAGASLHVSAELQPDG